MAKTAQEAGIRFQVFLTRAVYDAYVIFPPEVTIRFDVAEDTGPPMMQ